MIGRVIYVTTRLAGASVVGDWGVGEDQIQMDNLRDFPLDAGFVYVGEDVLPYTSVDRAANLIQLATPLVAGQEMTNGDLMLQYPYAVQRWALVAPPSSAGEPVDAVWVVVPHALSGFIAADGQRAEDNQERVDFQEQPNKSFMVMDVIDRQPWLDPFVIPDGAIKTTMITDEAITTPLLASNSVATQHLQAGAVKTVQLDADAINGMTITGALIRSAAAGRRVEMSSDGIIQFDSAGNVIFKLGDQNKFTGEIDATGIIIRDSLQLFGRNNLFATGSKITLKATSGDPSNAPALSWDYEAGPAIGNGAYWYPTGVHSVNGSFHSATYVFLNYGLYRRADGKYWQFPNITVAPGDVRSEFKPWSMVRIAKADNGAERVVMMGEDYTHMNNGYPETWMRVYDDSTLNTSGTGAPVLKAEWKVTDFSWFLQYRLGRHVNGAGDRHQWILISLRDNNDGGNKTLKWAHYRWNNDDVTKTVITDNDMGPVVGNSYGLSGGAIGSRANLNIDITSGNLSTDFMLMVGLTGVNCVYNYGAGGGWEINSYWQSGWTAQDRMWIDGDPVAGTMTNYYAWNWSTEPNIQTYKFTNNHKRNPTSTIWAGYTWRGEASSGFQTKVSPWASIAYRARARLKVTMPALPAPIAGVGMARDPAKDVYGWRYFVANSASSSAPANLYEGTTNPAMAPNTALAVSAASLESYPTNTGTTPPASNNFPASAAATIESDNGALVIDGNGDIVARDVVGDSVATEAVSGARYKIGMWTAFSLNVPNVPMTVGKAEYMRIGQSVWIRASITLTAGISTPFIDLPFNFAPNTFGPTDALQSDHVYLGKCRAIRAGVSWYEGDICAFSYAGGNPARATIFQSGVASSLDSAAGNQWHGTNPGTWASGDRWSFDFMYKAAA